MTLPHLKNLQHLTRALLHAHVLLTQFLHLQGSGRLGGLGEPETIIGSSMPILTSYPYPVAGSGYDGGGLADIIHLMA